MTSPGERQGPRSSAQELTPSLSEKITALYEQGVLLIQRAEEKGLIETSESDWCSFEIPLRWWARVGSDDLKRVDRQWLVVTFDRPQNPAGIYLTYDERGAEGDSVRKREIEIQPEPSLLGYTRIDRDRETPYNETDSEKHPEFMEEWIVPLTNQLLSEAIAELG